MTKPARRLLANLGLPDPPPCYVAVTEAALAAAQRRGMERAAQMLERMAHEVSFVSQEELLKRAALQVRARAGEEE